MFVEQLNNSDLSDLDKLHLKYQRTETTERFFFLFK